MCELTLESAGIPRNDRDPLAAFKERQVRLLREQDEQIKTLRALIEDMRDMNTAALAALEAT